MFERLDAICRHHDELAARLSDPAIYDIPGEYQKIAKEVGKLEPLVRAWQRLTQVRVRRSEAEPMARQQVLNGRTQANRSVRIAAEIPGEVIEIMGEKGDQVAEGDLLVRLDPRDRAAALAEARATLEQRRIEAEAAERLGQRVN